MSRDRITVEVEVAKLEDEIGTKLFYRTKRKVELVKLAQEFDIEF